MLDLSISTLRPGCQEMPPRPPSREVWLIHQTLCESKGLTLPKPGSFLSASPWRLSASQNMVHSAKLWIKPELGSQLVWHQILCSCDPYSLKGRIFPNRVASGPTVLSGQGKWVWRPHTPSGVYQPSFQGRITVRDYLQIWSQQGLWRSQLPRGVRRGRAGRHRRWKDSPSILSCCWSQAGWPGQGKFPVCEADWTTCRRHLRAPSTLFSSSSSPPCLDLVFHPSIHAFTSPFSLLVTMAGMFWILTLGFAVCSLSVNTHNNTHK